jgi:hypothetical protein
MHSDCEEGLNLEELLLEQSETHRPRQIIEEDPQLSVALDTTFIAMSAPTGPNIRVVTPRTTTTKATRREHNRRHAQLLRHDRKKRHARLAKAIMELSEWRSSRDTEYARQLSESKRLYNVVRKRNADDYCDAVVHAVLKE